MTTGSERGFGHDDDSRNPHRDPSDAVNTWRLRKLRAVLLVVGLSAAANGCDEVRRALTVPDALLQVTDSTCATAAVRWGDGSANDTELVVALPWSRDLGTATGLILVLAARRECEDDGTITAEIYLDGDLEDRGSATGPHAVAGASTSFF